MTQPRPFRFGVQLSAAADSAQWSSLAREAESLGYSTLFMPDHFDNQLAPLPALATAAAATTTLRVGTAVLDNDFKHPVVTAKEAATLDLLSEGRLELGLGAGWMLTDYERSGIPMDPPGVRIDRLEEAVTVLKGLFGGEPLSFAGKHYTISELEGAPLPVQSPHPPLLIGGGGPRLLSLAAREADIVGVNPSLRPGRINADVARDGVAAATDRKLAVVREAAGDRADDIEINLLLFACMITDDRRSALEAFAGGFGLEPDELSEYPHVLIGSEDEICAQLEQQRARWGVSYLTVQGTDAMRAAAPVVARMAGV